MKRWLALSAFDAFFLGVVVLLLVQYIVQRFWGGGAVVILNQATIAVLLVLRLALRMLHRAPASSDV